MTIATATRSDQDIQTAVQDELDWTSEVDAAAIGVAVDGGVVALSGQVEHYSARIAAKHAALRVHGVTAIMDNVSVHPSWNSSVTETDIAKEVEHALTWASNVPDTVKPEIEGHDVTLTGPVTWDLQRRAAQHVVQHLKGVQYVNNLVTLTPRVSAPDTEERIRDAITRKRATRCQDHHRCRGRQPGHAHRNRAILGREARSRTRGMGLPARGRRRRPHLGSTSLIPIRGCASCASLGRAGTILLDGTGAPDFRDRESSCLHPPKGPIHAAHKGRRRTFLGESHCKTMCVIATHGGFGSVSGPSRLSG